MGKFKLTACVFWACAIFLLDGCTNVICKSSDDNGKQINVKEALHNVEERMQKAMQMRPDDLKNTQPTLVAVSTAQSVASILQACEAGQRHFGESYVHELVSKANNKKIRKNCPEIKWHFIGSLTSKEVLKLVSVPNLHMIETVNTGKLATSIEQATTKRGIKQRIGIFVQPNTSKPDVTVLVKRIIDECPHLKFSGFMTPGKNSYDSSKGPNPDYLKLVEYKKQVCKNLNLKPAEVQLSMGMTKDFEKAIAVGSDSVRVGTQIFGQRKSN